MTSIIKLQEVTERRESDQQLMGFIVTGRITTGSGGSI